MEKELRMALGSKSAKVTRPHMGYPACRYPRGAAIDPSIHSFASRRYNRGTSRPAVVFLQYAR